MKKTKKFRKSRGPRGGFRFGVSIAFLLLLPAALLLNAIAAKHPTGTDYLYSRHIYPPLSAAVSALTGLIPIPAWEVLLFALAAALLFWLVRRFLALRALLRKHKKGTGRAFLLGTARVVLRLACAGCAGYFLFIVMWGLNYNRLPLAQNLGYRDGAVTTAELSAVMTNDVDAINALVPQVHWSGGVSFEPGGIPAIQRGVNEGYVRLHAENPMFDSVPVHPKRMLFSTLMAYTGTDGIFIPFTYDPSVSTIPPQYALPFNMAHESAHFKGFAREDEANYIAYLADLQNTDPYFHYSAYMMAYTYVSNALYSTDQDAWSRISGRLSPRAGADLAAYNRYVERYSGPVQDTSQKINDSYLKSQGQTQGIQSYDGFVNLLCAQLRTQTGK